MNDAWMWAHYDQLIVAAMMLPVAVFAVVGAVAWAWFAIADRITQRRK
jgi:hypothetical protein